MKLGGLGWNGTFFPIQGRELGILQRMAHFFPKEYNNFSGFLKFQVVSLE